MYREENNHETIACEPDSDEDKTDNDDDDKSRTGESEPKRARKEKHAQFEQAVTIDHNMPGASTSAILKSECRTVTNVHFLIFLCSCPESIEFR